MMQLTKQRRSTRELKFPLPNPRSANVERTYRSSVNAINTSQNIISLKHCNSLNLQLLLWIIFISCSLEPSLGETPRPLNRVATAGEKVQLKCSTQQQFKGIWKYTKPFESNERRIYDGYRVVNDMKNLFSVNESVKGQFNLIFNASESTPGRYTCRPDIKSDEQSAEVIVLDKPPNCSTTATSGVVNASCWIDFKGNWAPEIHWHNANGTLQTYDSITVQNQRVTSFLIVPFNKTDILTCTPMFALKNKPYETTATNVPDPLISCVVTIGPSSENSSTVPTTITTTSTTPPYIIVVVVGLVLGVSVIVAVLTGLVVFLRKGKMCAKSSRNDQLSQTEQKTGML